MTEITEDIPFKKLIEEALDSSEARYRTIFEATGTATFTVDEDGVIWLVNMEFEKLSGYSKAEIEGKMRWMDFIPEQDRERMMRYHVLRRKDPDAAPRRYEATFMGRDGGIKDILVTVAMVPRSNRSIGSFLDITERNRMDAALCRREKELDEQSQHLEAINTALRVLLKKREEDKKEFEEKILSNMKELVLPYLEKLKKTHLDQTQKLYVDILEANVGKIVSPFLQNLSSKFVGLSPMEIQVANLIKEGKGTKEIAELLCISENTVLSHRYHLRTKLRIKGKSISLRSYLKTLVIQ
jgi:PAS domain S-box-containing protein